MVPWLCLIALRAVLCAHDVRTSMVYWMSAAEASYLVGAMLTLNQHSRIIHKALCPNMGSPILGSSGLPIIGENRCSRKWVSKTEKKKLKLYM
jgi:hypothetical protein